MNNKSKTYEKELPSGYKQDFYLNAKDVKLGIILNLIALAILSVTVAVAVLLLMARGKLADLFVIAESPEKMAGFIIAHLIFLISLLLYIVLHELVHGLAYKKLTGQKLTFGISWSCAFCGVPHIYTYRRTALIAVAAPFLLFSILFIPLLILLYFTDPYYFILASVVFGLHVGGCVGDLYVMYLLLFKFKDSGTLMRDTGPEQYFFVPCSDPTEDNL